jgi:hypothetical protein
MLYPAELWARFLFLLFPIDPRSSNGCVRPSEKRDPAFLLPDNGRPFYPLCGICQQDSSRKLMISGRDNALLPLLERNLVFLREKPYIFTRGNAMQGRERADVRGRYAKNLK